MLLIGPQKNYYLPLSKGFLPVSFLGQGTFLLWTFRRCPVSSRIWSTHIQGLPLAGLLLALCQYSTCWGEDAPWPAFKVPRAKAFSLKAWCRKVSSKVKVRKLSLLWVNLRFTLCVLTRAGASCRRTNFIATGAGWEPKRLYGRPWEERGEVEPEAQEGTLGSISCCCLNRWLA